MRELRESVTPTLVLAPNPHDTHQDHRVVAEAARREFRYGEILWHYEVNQFGTENRFQPNIFVDLSGAYPAPAKLREVTIPDFPPHLLEGDLSFAHAKVVFTVAAMISQRRKPVLDPERLLAFMRVRSLHRDNRSEFAEAFAGRMIF